jgi:DNA-binding LytR/AlgR family response regulator
VSIHFGWFFFVSSYYSPYLGFPATRYGVYPYFFIFWSAIDIGLLGFVFDQINRNKEDPRTFDTIRIELVRGDKKYFCESRQVYWLAADNYYTKLYTEYGTFLMRKSLKHFKDLLPPEEFKKIHRSTVININQVSQLVRGKNDSLEVVLKDGNKRRVSRKYMKELRNILHAGSF